jgi:hypothetical protein
MRPSRSAVRGMLVEGTRALGAARAGGKLAQGVERGAVELPAGHARHLTGPSSLGYGSDAGAQRRARAVTGIR